MNKTKIICTLGPASSSEKVISKMLDKGMNVARVNFSHGTHESHGQVIDMFRKVRDEKGIPAAVMLDTKGPEIRLGTFNDGQVTIARDSKFTFTSREVAGDETMVSVTFKDLPRQMKKGEFILVDDGMMKFKVIESEGEDILCKALTSGKLKDHKGVNIPDKSLEMEYLSEVDKSDILFGIEKDVDYVAASFMRRNADALDLRNFLDVNGGKDIKIIAKIENLEGINNVEEILEVVDGIMVARGDMGVEVNYERLPGIQKQIIRRCKEAGKIVITATQMLESMIENPMPTRAEITDVANAVFQGTSAVMLSGESAAGKYPVEAVSAMSKIIKQSEKDFEKYGDTDGTPDKNREDITNAVGHGAGTIAKDIKASALIAITKTGYTANKMSKFRPSVQIVGVTPELKAYHQMALIWGVNPLVMEDVKDLEELFKHSVEITLNAGLIKKGDHVVITAGVPVGVAGSTNIIRVETV
ncbi:MAG: pyruvate kinase [Clostridia bacterium]|nr:pyruvate kinase [Clostridia bacterium]